MKKIAISKKIFAVLLCMIMTLSILPTSVFAAKEMFREITSAGVTDIDAPVAGQTGDYTADVVNTGVYTVEKIEYYESAGNRLKPQNEAFKYDTEYYVLISLKTKSAALCSVSNTSSRRQKNRIRMSFHPSRLLGWICPLTIRNPIQP